MKMDVKIKDRKIDIEYLRIALNMCELYVDYTQADLIIRVSEQLKKSKGEFTMSDSVNIHYAWKEEWDWVYAEKTDFFIKGDLQLGSEIQKIIFVRTINNNDGWFSMGWWAGRLDIDGSLNAQLINN